MKDTEIIKIVKQKLFEPRKKIVFDANGKRILVENGSNGNGNQQYFDKNVSESDKEVLEYGGWNIADKEYVEFKFNQLKQIFSSQLNAPSAPLDPIFEKNSTPFSTNHNNIVLHSSSEYNNGDVEFFSPGVFLKKGWSIVEFNLFTKTILDTTEEFSLNMISVIEPSVKNTDVVSKIKPNKKQLFTSSTKIKIDSNKIVIFTLKNVKQETKWFLQLTLSQND